MVRFFVVAMHEPRDVGGGGGGGGGIGDSEKHTCFTVLYLIR